MKNQSLLLFWVFALFLSIFACNETPPPTPPPPPPGPGIVGGAPPQTILSLSDIHLDVFYNTNLVNALKNAPYNQWATIFAQHQQTGFGENGSDTHYNLFASLVKNLPNQVKTPTFVIISGDFVAHSFLKHCEANGMSLSESQDFLANVIHFIADQLKALYPNAVFIPVLGNNDSYCGDYKVLPNGKFLQDMAPIWENLLGNSIPPKTFRPNFKKGGYFAAFSPANHKHRILGLNSILFSKSYMGGGSHKNYCSVQWPQDSIDKYAQEHLNWLGSQLQAARRDTGKVWMVYHIPPGINVPGVLDSHSAPDPTFWQDAFSDPFVDTVNAYQDVITAQLAGHTHMDHFMIINTSSGQPSSFVHITPAVSPVFYNNPAYFKYTFDPGTTVLQDYTAYYFQGVADASKTDWKEEYNFQKLYGQSSITAQALNQLRQTLDNNSSLQDSFRANYSGKSTATSKYFPDQSNWSYFSCALTADSSYSVANHSCIEIPSN